MSQFGVERFPWRLRLVLGNAQCIFARLRESGERDRARPSAADITHNQLKRPPDRRIRLASGSERAETRVDIELSRDRAVENEQWSDIFIGRLNAAQIEFRLRYRLGNRNEYRQIFRRAAGHYPVNSYFFDCRLAFKRVEFCDNMSTRQLAMRQHLLDLADGRRHDWQTVGPSPPVEKLIDSCPGIVFPDHFDAIPWELSGQRKTRRQTLFLGARLERVVDPFARRALRRGQQHQRLSAILFHV